MKFQSLIGFEFIPRRNSWTTSGSIKGFIGCLWVCSGQFSTLLGSSSELGVAAGLGTVVPKKF